MKCTLGITTDLRHMEKKKRLFLMTLHEDEKSKRSSIPCAMSVLIVHRQGMPNFCVMTMKSITVFLPDLAIPSDTRYSISKT